VKLMKRGDLIRYWFAPKYPIFGVVIEKYDYQINSIIQEGTYLYTVDILKPDGTMEKFDIHEGDKWELIGETR